MAIPAIVKSLGKIASQVAIDKAKGKLTGGGKKKKPKVSTEKLFERKKDKPVQAQDGQTFVYSGKSSKVVSKEKIIPTSDIDKAKNLSNQKENTSNYIKNALDSINSVASGIWKSLKSRSKNEESEAKGRSLSKRITSSVFSAASAPIRVAKRMGGGLIKKTTKFFGSILLGIGSLVLVTYIDEIMAMFKMIVKVVGAGARLLVGIFNFMIDKIYPAIAPFLPKEKQIRESKKNLETMEKEAKEIEKDQQNQKDNKNKTNDKKVDNKISVLEFKRDSPLTPNWEKERLQKEIDSLKSIDFNQGGLVQNFNQGGIVTDPKEKKQQEAYMLKYVNEERAIQGLEPLTNLTYASGVELTKMMGPGPRTKETSDTFTDLDRGIETTSTSKTVDGKTTFGASMRQTTEEDRQKFFAENPIAAQLLNIKDQAELDDLGASISASAKMNSGGPVKRVQGMVRGKGGVDQVRANLTQGEFVVSAPAVRKFGVETFKSMNAAAGSSSIPTISMDGAINAKDGGYMGDEAKAGQEWGEDTPELVEVVGPALMQWMQIQNSAVDNNPDAYGGIKLEMDRDGKMPNFGKFIADMSEQSFLQSVDSIKNNDAMQPAVKEAVLKKMSYIKQETLNNPHFKSDISFDINKDIPGTQANRILIAAQQDTTSPAAKAGLDYVERARLLNRRENKKKITDQIKNISVDTDDDSGEEIQVPLPPTNKGGGMSGGGSSTKATFIPIKIDNMGELTKQALYKE